MTRPGDWGGRWGMCGGVWGQGSPVTVTPWMGRRYWIYDNWKGGGGWYNVRDERKCTFLVPRMVKEQRWAGVKQTNNMKAVHRRYIGVCVPVCECVRFAFSSRFWLAASEVYSSGATQDRKLTYKNGGTDCERYGNQGRSQDGRHWQARKLVFELTGIITLLNLLWSHGDSQVWTAFQDRKDTPEVSPCTDAAVYGSRVKPRIPSQYFKSATCWPTTRLSSSIHTLLPSLLACVLIYWVSWAYLLRLFRPKQAWWQHAYCDFWYFCCKTFPIQKVQCII